MNREEIQEILFDTLISNFSEQMEKNPKWNFNDYYEAWERGEEYAVPEFVRRPMLEMKKDSCTRVFNASDGYRSIAILNFEDIVNAIMLEFAKRKEQVIAALDDRPAPSGPPEPPPYLAEEVARQKRTVGTPKKITYTDPSKPAWKIYAKGYAATGESGGATYLGTGYGDTFDEACAWLKKYGEISDPKLMSKGNGGKWYFWGCELFNNLHDAQRRYG